MSSAVAGIAFLVLLVAALAATHAPLGDYMYRVYTSPRDLKVEKAIYRVIGVDAKAEQSWPAYARSVLAFSAVGVLVLFFFELFQDKLPLHLHDPATKMTPSLAWDTAVSFVTNTSWQSYAGESTEGHLVQMAGLAVQSFLSGAVGMAVAVALVRGFARDKTQELGNFWVDMVRGTVRILLPIAFVGAVVLLAGGVIQNFHLNDQVVTTLNGVHQTITGGPVASQEPVKLITGDGGGFYNAQSAHPFENPSGWTNGFQIFLMFVIPFSMPRTFGRMVDSKKQGYAIAAVMGVLVAASEALVLLFQVGHHGTVPTATGAAMEGVEQRFGVFDSAVFAGAGTLTSDGAVDSMHDSYTSLGGLLTMFNQQLGEIAPGGIGSGLYALLVLAVISVFIAGLMVGRTPEYLGKKIRAREMTLSTTFILATELAVLLGTGIAMAFPSPRASMANTGPHGLSEVLYAFTSAGNTNGSAFAGLSANTLFYNTALGLSMLLGRYLPMILVLALAGSLARQGHTPASVGTLPTHRPQFVGLVAAVAVILCALTFLPALALGPLAEGIH
ncbi:potassium-transporting ATPase subunit KdpA [Candidatus Mycobacterium methanotrophicum]|uniref:Potassium-transporting ATPase potassium-binding subunit n=1 Tax=Candidatus Mycobacterium methanotrophicum TaxID=2943498 RepID=A0ABY4QNU2_9MYCO|nr:potassium-transporting ATPase subunit KdpA [Candidatus Mycobacterium methanotrophicum]UQX11526.1 potassium-transporting ATPase subunit KdpA [Candidatus Mycobacterium methanotrophicum]